METRARQRWMVAAALAVALVIWLFVRVGDGQPNERVNDVAASPSARNDGNLEGRSTPADHLGAPSASEPPSKRNDGSIASDVRSASDAEAEAQLERAQVPSATRVAIEVFVKSELDGAPIPGIAVELRANDDRIGAATTDESGHARVSTRVPSDVSVLHVLVPREPDDWFVLFNDRTLDASRADGATLEFSARPWPPPVAGEVRGLLRSEQRNFPDLDAILSGGVLLDLVSLEFSDVQPAGGGEFSQSTRRVMRSNAKLLARALADGEQVIDFVFEDVPEGSYELTLSSVLPFEWKPRSRLVTPPQSGLEFVRTDRISSVQLAFRVLDDATGDPIEGWSAWTVRATVSEENGVFVHAAPIELDHFGQMEHWNWSLWAPEHAPAFGNELAFDQRDDDGRLVATVRLARGWATRVLLLAREPTMRPVTNVPVLLDGAFAGRTDSFGFVEVRANELPSALSVDWPGYEVERAQLFDCDANEARRRGHITPVVLRKVK